MNLFDDIKATEIPGNSGGEFFYAQAIYSYFSDIEKLKAEGFTLTTICKYLEKKGVLPTNSTPRSFRRAFRREVERRKQVIAKEKNIHDTSTKGMKLKENAPKHEFSEVSANKAKREPENTVISVKLKDSKAGSQINPDYTFKIAPVDPDDLPDIN